MAWLRPKDIQDVQFRISEFMVEKAITLVTNMDVPSDIYTPAHPKTSPEARKRTQRQCSTLREDNLRHCLRIDQD